ncbi:MAG TPA: sugar ABC transporter permease [Mycobacteriales bacterium]|nr:sugar ABC transporter permease [Mycobacteriales bacterium]
MSEAVSVRARGTIRRRRRHVDLLPYGLVLPLAVVIVGLALVPAAFTTVEAFFRVSALDPPTRFIGLGNFRALLDTPDIRTSLTNTGLYVLIGVAVSTALAILMALILQAPFFGRSLVIAVLILPWALPGVVEGLVWTGIYDANYGLLNSVLTGLHLTNDYSVLIGTHRFLTIALIELVQIWQITPLSVLLILAVLQIIPGELYEAARLDGCGVVGQIRRITIPLARPGIAIAMVQALVATLNVFDQPYVLNGSATTGSSLMMQTYFAGFQNLDFGAGYALSLFITIATVVLSLIVVRIVYRPVEM